MKFYSWKQVTAAVLIESSILAALLIISAKYLMHADFRIALVAGVATLSTVILSALNFAIAKIKKKDGCFVEEIVGIVGGITTVFILRETEQFSLLEITARSLIASVIFYIMFWMINEDPFNWCKNNKVG